MNKTYTPAFKARIVQERLQETKTIAQLAAEHGIHPNVLGTWKATARKSLPALFEQRDSRAVLRATHAQQVQELYAQIGRLTTQVAWLKKKLAATLTRPERQALVERADTDLSLTAQADLRRLSRRSLDYRPAPPAAEDVASTHALDRIYTDQPSYGSRRIAVMLKEAEQVLVNRKAVQRQLREMGSAGSSPGPKLRPRNPEQRVYPDLLRGVTAAHPNHVWSIASTDIRLVAGWIELVAVLDLSARSSVRWALDDTLELPCVRDAVTRALAQARPTIWKSDQGSHVPSPQYTELLLDAEVQISMDGQGRALDTIVSARRWRTVKDAEVYVRAYGMPREARSWLSRYLSHSNEQRPHAALDDRTPAAVYFGPAHRAAVA